MQRQRKIALRDSLLSRYSDSLGEMMMRRRNETAMKAAHAESELASRTKSAFLATVSHELRTPLNSIIGFSDVILAMKDGGKAAEYATHIAKSGRRLLEVVTDILDISKIESGTFVLNSQPNDLAEIAEAAVEVMQPEIAAKHQTLDVRLPRDLPMLSIDFKRIKQVLVNLLSNASKFTPERGRIILVAKATPEGGATVAVADTGVGMSADQIAVAMRAFGQVQGHLSRTQEGTGLGLPIARGLARQHGGDLHLESQPGAGTTVFLTLPPDSNKSFVR
ncbi:MAG TPA: HAMP domain-containing sensor histidine kinase [Rhizomicrobium sp.]|jgi:two-component system cell cycle sensor histidine kinase PleC|nr:HAMP domain-containing sensor histidine kinase [Rhizomicrobium sp.]